MLDKLKLLIGLTDDSKDALLNALIEQAIEEAKNYTHNDDISKLEGAICSMVVYAYNRLGTEGVSSESYSNVQFDYSQDYPESIMRQLKAFRKVRVI